MAISRTREYSADRRGAEICGHPLWLASALDKIARATQRIHNPDAERNPATAHMFIINPLSGERMDSLFSTHPNTDNRIAALEVMAAEFAAPGGARSESQPETRRAQPSVPTSGRPSARGADTNSQDTGGNAGPWGNAEPEAPPPPPEPEKPKQNPWGRNPTGPKGRWS